jgi:hypothetical protein
VSARYPQALTVKPHKRRRPSSKGADAAAAAAVSVGAPSAAVSSVQLAAPPPARSASLRTRTPRRRDQDFVPTEYIPDSDDGINSGGSSSSNGNGDSDNSSDSEDSPSVFAAMASTAMAAAAANAAAKSASDEAAGTARSASSSSAVVAMDLSTDSSGPTTNAGGASAAAAGAGAPSRSSAEPSAGSSVAAAPVMSAGSARSAAGGAGLAADHVQVRVYHKKDKTIMCECSRAMSLRDFVATQLLGRITEPLWTASAGLYVSSARACCLRHLLRLLLVPSLHDHRPLIVAPFSSCDSDLRGDVPEEDQLLTDVLFAAKL